MIIKTENYNCDNAFTLILMTNMLKILKRNAEIYEMQTRFIQVLPVYTEHLFRQVLQVLPLPVYTEHLFRQVLQVLPLPVYTEHLFRQVKVKLVKTCLNRCSVYTGKGKTSKNLSKQVFSVYR
jgi:hypothetical protein